jgi:hypothetical protein
MRRAAKSIRTLKAAEKSWEEMRRAEKRREEMRRIEMRRIFQVKGDKNKKCQEFVSVTRTNVLQSYKGFHFWLPGLLGVLLVLSYIQIISYIYIPNFDSNVLCNERMSWKDVLKIYIYNHHPFEEGGRSKCKLAIRRCFGGGPMKIYVFIFFFIVFIARLHFDMFVDCNYVPPRFTDLQLFSRGGVQYCKWHFT